MVHPTIFSPFNTFKYHRPLHEITVFFYLFVCLEATSRSVSSLIHFETHYFKLTGYLSSAALIFKKHLNGN